MNLNKYSQITGIAVCIFGIYAMKDAQGNQESFDECHGDSDATRGYHDHAASPSENLFISFISCLHGESVSADGPPPRGP
ncbi:hypothetical protein ACPUVO_15090 [Pseudocolwellia sp. HL-MZ19]|uniref:hypothetical protein n=1 Tax=Pseudocolwellia sp. HL-MZ19 TaxID=3400846 RepID=UPI003CF06B53